MNKIQALLAGVVLTVAALVAAILGVTSSMASQQASRGALVSVHKTALGKLLVEGRGHTLYVLPRTGLRCLLAPSPERAPASERRFSEGPDVRTADRSPTPSHGTRVATP